MQKNKGAEKVGVTDTGCGKRNAGLVGVGGA